MTFILFTIRHLWSTETPDPRRKDCGPSNVKLYHRISFECVWSFCFGSSFVTNKNRRITLCSHPLRVTRDRVRPLERLFNDERSTPGESQARPSTNSCGRHTWHIPRSVSLSTLSRDGTRVFDNQQSIRPVPWTSEVPTGFSARTTPPRPVTGSPPTWILTQNF